MGPFVIIFAGELDGGVGWGKSENGEGKGLITFSLFYYYRSYYQG